MAGSEPRTTRPYEFQLLEEPPTAPAVREAAARAGWDACVHGHDKARAGMREDGACKACIRWANRRFFRRKREWLRQYKLERGCDRCGYRRSVAALDFHHRDPSKKRYQVSLGWGRRDLHEEVARCDLLCKNCHAEHHEGESRPPRPSDRRYTCYLSGPMSGYVGHNFEAFKRGADLLRELGWQVISPAEEGVVEGWSWKDYISRDIELVCKSDAIVFLPGWQDSDGACIEALAALRMGLPAYQLTGDGLQGERKESGNLDWDEGEEAEALAKKGEYGS